MSDGAKILLFQFWFFIGMPLLGAFLIFAFGFAGIFVDTFLFFLWMWELSAFFHYRYCRQEEFLHVLQTAAATQAPIEAVLRAYLNDRPREHLYRAGLLFFVFPGYYWIHLKRSFDYRLSRLLAMLDGGVPLDRALRYVPGLVSREVALAITVGQFSGTLPHALASLPDRRLSQQWLELVLRLMYPVVIFLNMLQIVAFIMIFIVPKFEMIFLGFKMRLPFLTQLFIDTSRWFGESLTAPLLWLLPLLFLNVLFFSSQAKWHCPGIGWLYRLYARGQFLRMLGLMMETGKPLPEILDRVIESKLLPGALVKRVQRLSLDLVAGQPLAACLVKHGLATASMQGLIVSAGKLQNLPAALQSLGEALVRRGARLTYRIAMVLFPLSIFAMACLVGVVAVALFAPLVQLLDGLSGGR